MRVYKDFKEAKNEIARDLNELGREVFAGYQSKDLSELDFSKMKTKELTDYDYVVLKPDLADLNPIQPWANREWNERLAGILGRPQNPGHAWEARKDLWQPLLERRADDRDGERWEFSYTYSERFAIANVPAAVEALRANLYSRQVWVPVWNTIDNDRLGQRRVPCSLGYQVTFRDGRLNIAYHMRSSDFATHFDNDVWLAMKLLQWFGSELGEQTGTFTHKLGSLHVYAAEVEHVF